MTEYSADRYLEAAGGDARLAADMVRSVNENRALSAQEQRELGSPTPTLDELLAAEQGVLPLAMIPGLEDAVYLINRQRRAGAPGWERLTAAQLISLRARFNAASVTEAVRRAVEGQTLDPARMLFATCRRIEVEDWPS